ncbi:MAG: PstS family phosphate ABC transporter substrate-binding protein [Candidatus Heteroscillospira sp.]|jgi:phosphate transport system substrate-binding protein
MNIKGILAAALAAVMLTGCSGTVPERESSSAEPSPEASYDFKFTRENFPRLDGSTSMVPMAKAVASVLLGEDTDSVSDLVSFNRTSQSFRNLMYGGCDLLIVAEPSQNVLDELAEQNFEYDMAHISTDALVFVVNADNPVDSLTADQIRKIYTGEITNWSQVGGNDEEIIPFQRNAEAGSQAAMVKTVMDGLEMMEPPKDYIVDSMMGLMEAVKSFDGSAGAIGYSVYYYANDMKMADGLKIIAVDGVQPEADTIRSGSYPFLAPGYAVVAKDAPEDSPARRLWNWLQAEEGQYLMSELGYVSVREF